MTPTSSIAFVYFVYGLSFFSMGLAITLEIGRGSDVHLRHALRPMAAFGYLHGAHEWLEMFQVMGHVPIDGTLGQAWTAFRMALLAFSFLSLTAFGAALLSKRPAWQRLSLLVPLAQAAVWGVGVLILRGVFPLGPGLLEVGETWSRYSLGVPAALLASVGLVVQQRTFRRAGMVQFGRDSLWAAVAFAWYGAVGQVFVSASALPPSDIVNTEAFRRVVGLPIQLVRAGAAITASVFVMRFLRAFEVEVEQQIRRLRSASLREARRREELRGKLLRQVVTAQEAERKRVARELHDDTGQSLTAIGLGLRASAKAVETEPQKALRNLSRLEGMVGRALDDLQRLISDLRPSHLDDLGLPAALRWYGKDLESRVPLNVRVEVSGEPVGVETTVNTALFRVAQEALTNVVKHAEAKHATVCVEYRDGHVRLEVQDDGRGFELNALPDVGRSSWGLLGMEERASLLGGRFEIKSCREQGTCVSVTVPIQGRDPEEAPDATAAGG